MKEIDCRESCSLSDKKIRRHPGNTGPSRRTLRKVLPHHKTVEDIHNEHIGGEAIHPTGIYPRLPDELQLMTYGVTFDEEENDPRPSADEVPAICLPPKIEETLETPTTERKIVIELNENGDGVKIMRSGGDESEMNIVLTESKTDGNTTEKVFKISETVKPKIDVPTITVNSPDEANSQVICSPIDVLREENQLVITNGNEKHSTDSKGALQIVSYSDGSMEAKQTEIKAILKSENFDDFLAGIDICNIPSLSRTDKEVMATKMEKELIKIKKNRGKPPPIDYTYNLEKIGKMLLMTSGNVFTEEYQSYLDEFFVFNPNLQIEYK